MSDPIPADVVGTVDRWQRLGRRAATGRRSRLRRGAYLVRHHVVRTLVKVHQRVIARGEPSWFQYMPDARSATEHADVIARAEWYLAGLGFPFSTVGPPTSPAAAPWMEPGYVADRDAARGASSGAPHRIVHRATPRAVVSAFASRSPFTVADPRLFSWSDCDAYAELRQRYDANLVGLGLPPKLSELVAARDVARRTAIVLATGPSAHDFDPEARAYDVRITCNSAVRDESLLEAFRPNIITFADAVFHFGPSRYAAAFRRDVLRAAELTDALMVVPAAYAGILVAHHPQLAGRIAPFTEVRGEWTWPRAGADHLELRTTGNILTAAMLPLAFATSHEVSIAGSDGRSAGERYFWRHSQALQYSDELMETVFAAHPSFFRDRIYGDYYEEHCRSVEELISSAEASGIEVRALTASHIPALRRRGASLPG
jgi:hypothetical protein